MCLWVVSYPAPNLHTGKGMVTLERFLGCTGALLHANIMQSITCQSHIATQCNVNHRTVFSLASVKPPAGIVQSLLCNQMQGHMKIVDAAAIWLAFAKVRMLSLQELRKRSNVTGQLLKRKPINFYTCIIYNEWCWTILCIKAFSQLCLLL